MNQKNHLIFCSFVPVGLEDYVSYFINHFDEFTYLHWKFPHSKSTIKSALIYYKSGHKIWQKDIFSLPTLKYKLLYFLSLPFHYLIYFWQAQNLLWKKSDQKKRIFIGVNYFCTFCGIILKKLKRVDLVYYRVMDFFPLPPSGIYRYLNRIFYIIDQFCLKNADDIWFTTEGHIIGREKYGYFNRKKQGYKIIPLGVNPKKFISRPINNSNRWSLVYCGVISKYHLLDLLFKVIWELKKEFKNIKLNLIGSGPDEDYFKKLARQLNLEKNIIFHGFVEEGERLTELMANNILGIALYKDEENFMKYTEPAKVKHYLSFGVPAVVSRVPRIAEELAKEKVCFAVDNKKEKILELTRRFILDAKLQNKYKDNIKKFVKTIDSNELLDHILETLP